MHKKWYLHIDMDAFFASVEIASRPYLKGKPVAVGGSIKHRTVITAASYEARKYGIKTGMSSFEAQYKVPFLTIIKPDIKKYESISNSIFNFIKYYFGNIKNFSIDECFTYTYATENEVKNQAKYIKNYIEKHYKITCSIGIGENKLIAKTATKENKPNGITFINNAKVYIENKRVGDIPGIGRKTEKKLHSLGIMYMRDIRKIPLYILKKHFKSYAYVLKEMAIGEDRSNILWNIKRKTHSIGNTRTLENDISNKNELYNVLSVICEHIAFRMSKEQFEGNNIKLIIRYNDFFTFTKSYNLGYYIHSSNDIFHFSKELLNSIQLQKSVRLIGVSLHNLRTKDIQMNLDFYKNNKNEKLLNTINTIKRTYGEWSIVHARSLNANKRKFLKFAGGYE